MTGPRRARLAAPTPAAASGRSWTGAALRLIAPVLAIGAIALAGPAGAQQAEQVGQAAPQAESGPSIVSHGLSIYGELKYPPDFTHFDYARPDAPKGGDVKLAAVGTFDSLNPFILKGVPAAGLGLTFQTLLADAEDEASAAYGLVAQSVEVPPDRSWVIFTLRPEARFQDGTPVTADDVIFSFNTVMEKGHPFYHAYYASVLRAEKLGERKVKFVFKVGHNRELPFILGNGLPILSKAYFGTHTFDKTTLQPILGSGPYKVVAVDPGRSITYQRVRDYWGADVPCQRGLYNFDTIRYDYYRDSTVELEAFKAGEYDFRMENTAKVWATGYDFPALREGLVVKEEIPNQQPTGMQAFVFNTRRAIFKDPRVRDALAYAFDFEWTNKHLFYGAYKRTKSYFSNSELASRGVPGGEELKILERYRGRVPDEVFTTPYDPPSTDVEGGIRTNLLNGRRLLHDAGWVVRDDRLVNGKTGEPFAFEVLLVNPAFERVVAPFVQNLRRLGIDARMRTVDTSQYQNRIDNFDFDMIVDSFGESLSPGNEQRDYWTSKAADTPGSRNTIGVHDPVVDELVDSVISAPSRKDLIARTHALDRVLLWSHYVIPHWHVDTYRVAFWNKFDRPAISPKYAFDLNTWWVDPDKAARLEGRLASVAGDKTPSRGVAIEDKPVALLLLLATAVFALWLVRRARAGRRT
jgi:microcin C transport system substrate-binding protein